MYKRQRRNIKLENKSETTEGHFLPYGCVWGDDESQATGKLNPVWKTFCKIFGNNFFCFSVSLARLATRGRVVCTVAAKCNEEQVEGDSHVYKNNNISERIGRLSWLDRNVKILSVNRVSELKKKNLDREDGKMESEMESSKKSEPGSNKMDVSGTENLSLIHI